VKCSGEKLFTCGAVLVNCSFPGDVLDRTDDITEAPLVFDGRVCDFAPAVARVPDGMEVLVGWMVGEEADFGLCRSASFIGSTLLALGDDLDITHEVPAIDAVDEEVIMAYFAAVNVVPVLWRRPILVGSKAAERLVVSRSLCPVASPSPAENSHRPAGLKNSCWSGVFLPACPGFSRIGCESRRCSDGDLLDETVAGDPDVQRGLLAAESDDEASLSGSCCGCTRPDLTSFVALMR